MKNVTKLSEQELNLPNKTSWHDQYRNSAWIFIGGLPFDLSEGDVICIFSQYGEIVNINLVRAKDTGKSRGFCFICYEDQRSTDLAVDNLNGIKILNRTVRVDHVNDYKAPKDTKKTDEEEKKLRDDGCAPKMVQIGQKGPPVAMKNDEIRETLADQIDGDIKLPPRLPIYSVIKEEPGIEIKQEKDEKKKKKSKKSRKRKSSSSESSSSESDSSKDSDKRKHKKKKNKRSKDKNGESSSEDSANEKRKRCKDDFYHSKSDDKYERSKNRQNVYDVKHNKHGKSCDKFSDGKYDSYRRESENKDERYKKKDLDSKSMHRNDHYNNRRSRK